MSRTNWESMATVVNETDQLVQFLKNVKLFAELSPDSLAKLGTCLKTAEFPPAEVIVREGAPGVSMYIIKSGLGEIRPARCRPAASIAVSAPQSRAHRLCEQLGHTRNGEPFEPCRVRRCPPLYQRGRHRTAGLYGRGFPQVHGHGLSGPDGRQGRKERTRQEERRRQGAP